MTNPRYEGKPFLRLLECYVMWCAGVLDDENATKLEGMTPRLQATYSASESWQEILAGQMQFPPELQSHIQKLWTQNVNASVNQTRLSPEHFAQYIVDENFSHMM
jgi:hypothetical protein